jgi:hypothetical protein
VSNPNYVPGELTPHPNRGSNRTVLIIIGVVAALVLVIVGSYVGTRIAQDDGSDTTSDLMIAPDQEDLGDGSESDRNYDDVDPATLTVDQFYSDSVYPEEYRVRWADEVIQERTTPELLEEIGASLRSDNREPLGRLVPASINNTGDEILAQQTVAGYIASTASTPDEGRKLLAGFLSPDNPGFDGAKDQLGGGQKPVLATYFVGTNNGVKFESPVFRESAVGSYVPNGTPSKLLTIINTFDGTPSQITLKFYEGRWITVNTIERGDLDWILRPDQANVR